MKLTPWFPPEVPPVHPGVYEVEPRWTSEPLYRRWDGQTWRLGGSTPGSANRPGRATLNDRRWRGIQKD